MKAQQIKYFSSYLASSTAGSTITLTPLNSGYADIYVQIFNSSIFQAATGGDKFILPNPTDKSSYLFTTANTEDNHVYIPPQNSNEELIIVAAAYALSDVKFIILSTSSQSAILLQPGNETIFIIYNFIP